MQVREKLKLNLEVPEKGNGTKTDKCQYFYPRAVTKEEYMDNDYANSRWSTGNAPFPLKKLCI